MPLLRIDERLCEQTGACVDVCPGAVIKRRKNSPPLKGCPPLLEALSLPPGQKGFGGLVLGYPKCAFRLVPSRKASVVDWR